MLTLCLSLALLINPLVMARATVQLHPAMSALVHCATMQHEMSGMNTAMDMPATSVQTDSLQSSAPSSPLSKHLPQHDQNCLNPCCGHGVMAEPTFVLQHVVRPEHRSGSAPVITAALMTAQGFYTQPDRPPRIYL